jgi:formylmethanofuran dehydrogenase subunit B
MAAGSSVQRDIACPFCGLVCDDLEIEAEGARLRINHGACPISRAQFEGELPIEATAMVAGAACSQASAIAASAAILRASRLPLYGGLATDIAGLRGALALADRTGGVIDHRGSRGLFADLTVLRDIGTMTTTFSEVRNRADLLLLIGPDPLPAMPRLLERCFSDAASLTAESGIARQLIHLGPPSPLALPPGLKATQIGCAAEDLAPMVARLRALVKGRAADESAELDEIVDALRNATYPVVAWVASLLPADSADLIVLSLVEMVRDLNRAHRAACLPLGGAENLTGAHQACLWQTGHPLRTGFGTGAPRHDPLLFAAGRLIDSGEVDALVWISTLGGPPPPRLPPELPLILLAPPGTAASAAAVFLPVGRPGIDHAGQIFRGDGVVALPLAMLRPTALPSAAATLADILASLGAP